MNQSYDDWHTILSSKELNAYYSFVGSIDPNFASKQRAFYESRTIQQLEVLAVQSRNSCTPTSYQLARSHAEIKASVASVHQNEQE